MNIIFFLIGAILFTLFILSTALEIKEENTKNEDGQYYERYLKIKTEFYPKVKKGSQSRKKNYFWYEEH